MSTRRILRPTRVEAQRMQRERLLNHHIPDVLINRLEELTSVQYIEKLKSFSQIYKNQSFNDLEQEYEFIRSEILDLLSISFADRFASVIERCMRAAVASAYVSQAYREYFIHPFQDFLLGIVILDKFYDKFKEWYSSELCCSSNTCIEASWLLAALFHDWMKPLEALAEFIEPELGPYTYEFPEESKFIGEMSSLFEHLRNGNPLDNWSSSAPQNSKLSSVLLQHSKRRNHGVLGAFLLLRHVQKAFPEAGFVPNHVAAALSIAIHDGELRKELLEKGLFPLPINQFPLSCLLLYCDTVQEWARSRFFETEARLVYIGIAEDNVHCEVSFNRIEDARNKLIECDCVQRCILARDITFTFSPRVHVSVA